MLLARADPRLFLLTCWGLAGTLERKGAAFLFVGWIDRVAIDARENPARPQSANRIADKVQGM